ncbi:MAG: hypothetical protein LUC34_05015 [Campylobacter sp.]|nr:hypothetical protein [Campylobacter sp.]
MKRIKNALTMLEKKTRMPACGIKNTQTSELIAPKELQTKFKLWILRAIFEVGGIEDFFDIRRYGDVLNLFGVSSEQEQD